jgi:hypothetical protein
MCEDSRSEEVENDGGKTRGGFGEGGGEALCLLPVRYGSCKHMKKTFRVAKESVFLVGQKRILRPRTSPIAIL